jgi:hypothetical protein
MNDPDHPILDQPWRWEIIQFDWHSMDASSPSWLDVTFIRDGVRRTLRFIDPQDVTIKVGGWYPIQCGEMAILDVSRRQLDGLGVQVTEFGASGSPLRLYARSVLEVEGR